MKLRKTLFILVILLASFQISFGQENPKAELIDEFGKILCEDAIGRLDSFFANLQNNPDSTGYIIIYADKNSIIEGFDFEHTIKNHIVFRKVDEKQFVIIRGEKRDNIKIEFWKVPAGADKPSYTEEKWTQTINNPDKAFVFGIVHIDDVCFSFNSKVFAEFLIANPNLRGHIVIYNKSKKEAQKESKEWLEVFTNEFKVPRRQLRIYFSKNRDYPGVELWLVPQKKK